MHFPNYLFHGLVAIFATANAQGPIGGSSGLTTIDDFGTNPTGLQMNVYVPEQVAASPAIILALHGCFGSAESYAESTEYNSLADEKGFITIYPSTDNDFSCWEVNTAKGLTRDAGGDNQGLVSMIQYAIETYNADATKVFVTGSSSGCMMTNVLLATYPDVFAAATCYSGVAAGCLAGSPGASPISADPRCAGGEIIKAQEEWVAQAREMYPGYNGTYPPLATWHGTADTLVQYENLGEQLKQWSGVQGVALAEEIANTPETGYTKLIYGDGTKVVGYSAEGVGHTVPVHEVDDLAWFGL